MIKKNANNFFKPIELAVLATYLKQRGLLPDQIAAINAEEPRDPEDWDEEQDGIALIENPVFGGTEYALENAVARICLSGIQEDLPQWAAVNESGALLPARKIKSPLDLPPRILLSEYLFTINWAYSIFGDSWPDAYYATALPCFDVTIVTLSQDSTDVYGYCDLALGWFGKTANPQAEIGGIIRRYWKNLLDEGDQKCWVELCGTGTVGVGIAQKWAAEVWADEGSGE